MRIGFIGSISVVVAAIAIASAIHAQTPTGSGAARSIPDLSGLWLAQGDIFRSPQEALCGIRDVCGGVLGSPAFVRGAGEETDEPLMLPWAQEKYESVRKGITNQNVAGHQVLSPSWGGCMPTGPMELMRRHAFELRQFPDMVLLLFDRDHAVRRIYLDGRGHPPDLKPTWMGHSTGRYDGSTLAVDTAGISEKPWLFVQGHPHSDALHVTERIRRLDQKTLEVKIRIDDPKTYQKPWTKTVVRELQPPGPEVWDQTECEELLQMGTHYSAESPQGIRE